MSKRSKFLRAAKKLEHKSLYTPIFADPAPAWFDKIILRFARVFVPELRLRDVVENPEKFFGHVAAFAADVVERARRVRVSEIPHGKHWQLIRREIIAVRKNGPAKLRELKRVVAELPRDSESEFYGAYAESTQEGSVGRALQRLEQSNAAKICFFIICMRPHIEAKRFRTVTELLRAFMRLESLDPERKRFFQTNEAARRSLKGQFRDICSEDGLKLHRRGQPRKILPVAT